ncbi:hypothetical protein BHE90_001318 [Fusarium euwallaceae]|uniref:Xylanolytic transcriptional activator regulatory domain-containing protein n=1 Tax=Fusarium euwallaceae TaxID=1147111 RepID=A0A430M8D4_9HYPO|nr:hypothetical protein BHE90_001318 [Fusarium euwallaceae]
MDLRRPTSNLPAQGPLAIYEVPEFKVRRLDGHAHPALTATPGSGFICTGSGQWEAKQTERTPLDLDGIYRTCLDAQNSLVIKANELCEKRNLPFLDITTACSWSDVEASVLDTCKVLENLSLKDKAITPGFTGKLKKAFRSLCNNAGAGTTLANLVPTDSYLSVLCGGLRIIFKALEESSHYRQEVYNALEELPFILNDNATLLEIHMQDEELHRRVASLYTAIYRLMEVIVSWFLKPSLVTGTKIFINPSGFLDKLKDSLATVKVAAQRFAARITIMAAEEQRTLTQQNYTMMYMHSQHSQRVTAELGELKGELRNSNRLHLITLDRLTEFLQLQARETIERKGLEIHEAIPRNTPPRMTIENILDENLYDPGLAPTNCENVLKLRNIPGYDLDEDLVITIKSHPRFVSWLTLNQSSLLFVDTRSQNPTCSLELPIVSAEVYRDIVDFSNLCLGAEDGTMADLICLPFFCSQHRDFKKDPNASPTELAMSLLLQLLDNYRDFDPHHLERAFDELDQNSAESICFAFETLISQLPASVILVLLIDDLKAFAQPLERKLGTVEVVEQLLDIHRRGEYDATFKFLLGNSTQSGFSDELFTDDEVLRIWTPATRGYIWIYPIKGQASTRVTSQQVDDVTKGNQNDHNLNVSEAVGNQTTRPVDGELWVTLNDEIHKMKKIIEEDNPEALLHEDDSPHNPSEYSSPNYSENPQLDPVIVFKLWQIFLDRVSPLIKIIHVPSVQGLIVSAATDITLIPLDQQALMYSILGLAVLALRDDELAGILGEDKTREAVLQDMLKSVNAVLVRFDALKRYNMVILQALVHTSIILMGQCNKHASWILLGSLVRIAMSMGYHRDGTQLHLSPFETEMRRRIWWQIVFYDIKLGIDCGLAYSCIPKRFDTKQPLNLNDADLFPDATGELAHRDGPTEMAFVMIIHRVAQYLLDEETRQAVEANILGQEIHPTIAERNRILIDRLDTDLLDMEDRFINAKASNAHAAAVGIRPHLIKRLYDMIRPMHESPGWGVDVSSPRDNLFKLILSSCENASDSYERMDRWGFSWYIRLHFNLDLLASLSTFLYHRPLGSLADRGWTIFTSLYIRHTLLQDPRSKATVTAAQFALKAYAQREGALVEAGQSVETPDFITELRQTINSPLATPPIPAISNQWATLGVMTAPSVQMDETHEMNMHMFMPFTGEGGGDGSYDFWPGVPWGTN